MKAQILQFNPHQPKATKCQSAHSPQALELADKLDRLIRLGVNIGGIAMQIDRLEERATG